MIQRSKILRLAFGCLLIFCLFAPTLVAQNPETAISRFKGRVFDASTGEPIPGVSVYIAGSTVGASTSITGRYSFSTELTGNHNLVFSIVGFKSKTRSITLTANSSHDIEVKLEPELVQLQEVEVVSSNKEWKKKFEYFRSQFIGTTEFAEQTKIQNPWVLDFEKEGGILRAIANQPILVSNLALGYQIHIELIQFEWNTRTNLGIYKVYSLFEDIETDNEFQKQAWENNRLETFLGSKAHFFRSLYHGNWKENNYLLGYEDDLQQLSEEDLKYYFLTAESPYYEIPGGWKAYRLKDFLTVKYRSTLVHTQDFNNKTVTLEKTSGIESNRKDKIFFINEWGLLRDVASVYLYGVWKQDRIANTLPNNYTLEPGEYSFNRTN